ncbi:MAG: hypothetical protein AAF125_23570, partial [Chloroflexota bacterium]
ITTDGRQIFDENGNPLLPDFASAEMITMIGYMKWVMSSGATRATFGPFALIVQHARIFLSLTLAWFSSYLLYRLLSLILRAIVWLAENWMVAIVVIVIGLVSAFIYWLEVRFTFFTTSFEWIMDWLNRAIDWLPFIGG